MRNHVLRIPLLLLGVLALVLIVLVVWLAWLAPPGRTPGTAPAADGHTLQAGPAPILGERPASYPATGTLATQDAAGAQAAGVRRGVSSARPAAPPSELELMAWLRQAVNTDPKRALTLARQADQHYPRSLHAPRRALLRMQALVHLGRIAAARDAAKQFFESNPGHPLGQRVYRLTGMHPRPRPGPP